MDFKKYQQGIFIGSGISLLIWMVEYIIYFLITKHTNAPFTIFVLSTSGLLFIVGGLIGPGRYTPLRPLVIVSPRDGGTFYNKVPFKVFRTDDKIDKIILLSNEKELRQFDLENGILDIELTLNDFNGSTTNTVKIKDMNSELKSQEVLFTFYDINEFTDEELEEIENEEQKYLQKPLKDIRTEYISERSKNYMSMTFGLFTVGIISLAIPYLISL